MELLMIHILVCGLCGALGNIVLSNCHVITNTINGTALGSCRVQPNISSIYNCTWTLNNGWRSFGQFDSGGEICSFTQPLELTEGTYTYSIHFTPPSAATYSGKVKIVQPGTVMTSCAQVVDAGADLNCSCLTTKTASPPATVRWEGRDSEKLVKTNVQREDNGTQFTCHVTWAGRVYTSLIYTLIVNYTKGPDGVIITGPRDLTDNASNIIELVCSTTARVYPGVMFTWTPGVCQNVTHTANSSTCSFPSDVNLNHKLITCTAINNNNYSIRVSTSVTLRANGSRRDLGEEKSDTSVMSSTGLIIVVVFTIIATVIISLVLITSITRRMRTNSDTADQTTDLTGTEHTYTSTLRHTDTTYEVPLPPAQHTRAPSSPSCTTASPRENTEYADMELLPTEITYEAPIPPTQDVHTYMALHDIHSATTASFKDLNVPGDRAVLRGRRTGICLGPRASRGPALLIDMVTRHMEV